MPVSSITSSNISQACFPPRQVTRTQRFSSSAVSAMSVTFDSSPSLISYSCPLKAMTVTPSPI